MKRIFPYFCALIVCLGPLRSQADEEEVIFNPHPQITLEIQEESSSYLYVYGTLAVVIGYGVMTLTMPSVRAWNTRLFQAVRQAGR